MLSVKYQRHDSHALHVPGGASRVQFRGGVSAGWGGGGQGGGGGGGGHGHSVMVHPSQVEAFKAYAGHAVLDLLRPQLGGLLLLLDEPEGRMRRQVRVCGVFPAGKS